MHYVRLLRPYNWIKNLLVFVPLFFARDFFMPGRLLMAALSFVLFCAAASAVYVINDLIDADTDRLHSTKRNRPIASGAISPIRARIVLAALIALVIALCFLVALPIVLFISAYVIANVFYSLYLKHVAIVDILLVASFYLVRILVGGAAAHVSLSHWLILCVLFVALFLISGKRHAELQQSSRRRVLEQYSPELLQSIIILSAGLTIITYSIYTILVLSADIAVYSVFFVLLAMLRYLLLIYTTDKVEYPERALFADTWIFIAGIAWLACMYVVLYR